MEESGWVIERGDSEVSVPLYWAPLAPGEWSKDNLKACRFARKQDAEAVVFRNQLDADHGVRVCEHGWG